jgi:hypothetical protein
MPQRALQAPNLSLKTNRVEIIGMLPFWVEISPVIHLSASFAQQFFAVPQHVVSAQQFGFTLIRSTSRY